jgi:hypothetical protein
MSPLRKFLQENPNLVSTIPRKMEDVRSETTCKFLPIADGSAELQALFTTDVIAPTKRGTLVNKRGQALLFDFFL